MKRLGYFTILGLALVVLSAALFALHWLAFRDARTLTFYLWLDVIFLPIQILIVTLIIDRFLVSREKSAMLMKLNMVIGAFFSEVGSELLDQSHAFDVEEAKTLGELAGIADWTPRRFDEERKGMCAYDFRVDSRRGDLAELKGLLERKREFLVRLLENPNLLEHESFTNLLWAVFHLAEELHQRHDFGRLPSSDLDHLSGDIKRAYGLLIFEWIAYMRHLKAAYPYLFSLAVRTNPFNPAAVVEVQPQKA
jgi:hypothetical protein